MDGSGSTPGGAPAPDGDNTAKSNQTGQVESATAQLVSSKAEEAISKANDAISKADEAISKANQANGIASLLETAKSDAKEARKSAKYARKSVQKVAKNDKIRESAEQKASTAEAAASRARDRVNRTIHDLRPAFRTRVGGKDWQPFRERWETRLQLRMVKGVFSAIGIICIFVGLYKFGFLERMQRLGGEVSGSAGTVLLLLTGGALFLLIGLVGGQLLSINGQLPIALVVYLLISWSVLSNDKFFRGQSLMPTQTEAHRIQGIIFGVISVLFLLIVMAIFTEGTVTKAFNTSMGPTVIMLWSVVVVYAIAFIAAVALTNGSGVIECTETRTQNCVMQSAWPDYLLLLGLPGVAAAVAKSKEIDKSENLSQSSETTEKLTEVQFLVFNAIAMMFVIWSLATEGVLGPIPDVLLGLTGASALTFSLAKRLPAQKSPASGGT